VVWACADSEESAYSIFSPQAFVSKDYTPFFYDSEYWYYGKNVETEDNNNRFNEQVVNEWDDYLGHQLSTSVLRYLLLNAGKKQIDTVLRYINGKISILKPDSLHINTRQLDQNKIANLFNYLALAKDCEAFAVSDRTGWYNDPKPPPVISPLLETSLSNAISHSKDSFIKERLWFQLARYYYFYDDTTGNKKEPINNQSKILVLFDKYKTDFPKNLTYYRTLGYVAGYYRRKGDYAEANYLYSRCYDFSFEMKIPSKFSFRAQQESDWVETLKLARNNEEKITLWHMLGMEYDPIRAIKEIMALDPKSDKVNLLLSRLINARENSDNRMYFLSRQDGIDSEQNTKDTDKSAINEIRVVDSIAKKANTAKPYYWNIAAGYLHYMHKDYVYADHFYAAAKKLLPANDQLITAQYKMLKIFLEVSRLNRIDAKTELSLVEPLNWLKDFADGKNHIEGFRPALCADQIAKIYLSQGDTLKANCFTDTIISYQNKVWVQKIVDLMNKPDKSDFEKTMLRHYPHTLDQLYYHQALELVYKEEIGKAILLIGKMTKTGAADHLPANPFNGRLNDCHDCDQAAPQKQIFTPLTFLTTIQKIAAGLTTAKDKYRNAMFLANAYYNISYYGNNRAFYEADVFGGGDIYSQKISEKYYLLARKYAQTNEQKARCTFMASKCEHNDYYTENGGVNRGYDDAVIVPPPGKYFEELKLKYPKTRYYLEVLHECGYFKDFVHSKN